MQGWTDVVQSYLTCKSDGLVPTGVQIPAPAPNRGAKTIFVFVYSVLNVVITLATSELFESLAITNTDIFICFTFLTGYNRTYV